MCELHLSPLIIFTIPNTGPPWQLTGQFPHPNEGECPCRGCHHPPGAMTGDGGLSVCPSVCLSQVLCTLAMYKCPELGWDWKVANNSCKGLRDEEETRLSLQLTLTPSLLEHVWMYVPTANLLRGKWFTGVANPLPPITLLLPPKTLRCLGHFCIYFHQSFHQ